MNTVNELKIGRFKSHQAMGTLVAVEGKKELPIDMKRVFYVYGSKPNTLRGEHAHKECTQVLVCISGRCEVHCDDGVNKRTLVLNQGDQYLVIPPGIWASERYQTANTILLVFADKAYDPKDYIRDYNAFIDWRGSHALPKAA